MEVQYVRRNVLLLVLSIRRSLLPPLLRSETGLSAAVINGDGGLDGKGTC